MIAEILFAVSIAIVDTQGSPVPSAQCVGGGLVRRISDGAWSWEPASADEPLRCSAAGLEPVDVAPPTGGTSRRSVTVVFPKSRALRVHGIEGSVSVEWFRPTDEGLVRLARRSRAPDAPLIVDVATLPRVLTFGWPDGARVSAYVSPTADELAISKPRSGSEVVTWLGMRTVRPARLELGSGSATYSGQIDRAGFTSVAGVPPGRYNAAVIYKSGLTVPVPGPVNVEWGQTVDVRPAHVPPAGTVTIQLDPVTCRELLSAQSVEVLLEVGKAGNVVHRTPLDDIECMTTIDGAAPADYRVTAMVSGWSGTAASHNVTVRSDRVEEVHLSIDFPVVDGVALLGDRPASDVSLFFKSEAAERHVDTDREGRFNISLPAPGVYDVDIRSSEYAPGESRTLRITQGRQNARLVFSPGRLAVIARSAGGTFTSPIQIHVEGGGYARTAIALPDEFRAEFLGVPPGTYLVSGSGIPDWKTRQPKEIVIDDTTPEREVTVTLERQAARRVIVVNEAGEPVRGASVQAGALILKEEAPGTYEMPPPAGDRLRVRAAGYLPYCRDGVPPDHDLSVVLRRGGFTATLRFRELAPGNLGGIAGIPGNNCVVGVQSLDHRVERTPGGMELRLEGLPSGRYLYLRADGAPVTFDVPGDPVIVPQR